MPIDIDWCRKEPMLFLFLPRDGPNSMGGPIRIRQGHVGAMPLLLTRNMTHCLYRIDIIGWL